MTIRKTSAPSLRPSPSQADQALQTPDTSLSSRPSPSRPPQAPSPQERSLERIAASQHLLGGVASRVRNALWGRKTVEPSAKQIAACVIEGKKEGSCQKATLDLTSKVSFLHKTDTVSFGGVSMRLPVEERIAEKRWYHIWGPVRGKDIVWNHGSNQLYNEIRQGKHAPGIKLHPDRIEVTDPILKNRMDLLAKAYAFSVRHENKVTELHGSKYKFLVDKHNQRAYQDVIMTALRYGPDHPLLTQIFEGTQLGDKVDLVQLHRNIELWNSQARNVVLQGSKPDWTTGGLDIRVFRPETFKRLFPSRS